MSSFLEDSLLFQIEAVKLPRPEVEYRFAPPRLFRFDFAWPALMLAVEAEGGTWSRHRKSRHTTGQGFETDAVKYNMAARRGWCVLRFTSVMINNGTAINEIQAAIEERSQRKMLKLIKACAA
jgi:very-short-patch-repair endonuclease